MANIYWPVSSESNFPKLTRTTFGFPGSGSLSADHEFRISIQVELYALFSQLGSDCFILPLLVGVEDEVEELDEGNIIRYSGTAFINEGLGGRDGAEV